MILRKVAFIAFFILMTPMNPVFAAETSGAAVERQERAAGRQERFVGRVVDDLTYDRKQVAGEVHHFDRELERVLPLESPERKDFYRRVGDRYREYGERVGEAAAHVGEISVACRERETGCARPLGQALTKLRERNAALEVRLQEVERTAEKEADRIIRIIERRAAVREVLRDLQERLDALELRHREGERRDDERERKRLRKEIELRQLDLLSLPEASEDLLRHYRVAAERLRGEMEWLEVKREEYEALAEAAGALGGAGRNLKEEAAALRTLTTFYEHAALRLQRKVDSLDRKESDLSPAGTLRELDRSRELSEAYDSLRERYGDQINRYRQRAGDYAAELGL